jgi:hypothetical protein
MNLQNVQVELNLCAIVHELFTLHHCDDWQQKLKLQFPGKMIFSAPDFHTL